MKNTKATEKIAELEKRISELEKRPVEKSIEYHYHYQNWLPQYVPYFAPVWQTPVWQQPYITCVGGHFQGNALGGLQGMQITSRDCIGLQSTAAVVIN